MDNAAALGSFGMPAQRPASSRHPSTCRKSRTPTRFLLLLLLLFLLLHGNNITPPFCFEIFCTHHSRDEGPVQWIAQIQLDVGPPRHTSPFLPAATFALSTLFGMNSTRWPRHCSSATTATPTDAAARANARRNDVPPVASPRRPPNDDRHSLPHRPRSLSDDESRSMPLPLSLAPTERERTPHALGALAGVEAKKKRRCDRRSSDADAAP